MNLTCGCVLLEVFLTHAFYVVSMGCIFFSGASSKDRWTKSYIHKDHKVRFMQMCLPGEYNVLNYDKICKIPTWKLKHPLRTEKATLFVAIVLFRAFVPFYFSSWRYFFIWIGNITRYYVFLFLLEANTHIELTEMNISINAVTLMLLNYIGLHRVFVIIVIINFFTKCFMSWRITIATLMT